MTTRSALLLTGLAYLAFISLGLPDGLLGVAWPSIRATFGLPVDALGALLVMATTGYLLSSAGSGWLLARMGLGTLLALSCLLTAGSLLGYALTAWWGLMVGLGLFVGLGAGAIDAGINTWAARHFSARMVNWLHASFGLGATLGPLLMTSVLMAGQPWQRGYGLVGLWQLALALLFGLTRHWWAAPVPTPAATAPVPIASARSTLRLPAAWLGIAVFFVYPGLESATGTWAFSLLTERGIPMAMAGTWVSLYWGSLMVGRVLSGFVLGRLPVNGLLRLCIAGMAAGALLLWLQPTQALGLLGLALIGFGAAPVFPTLIATTPARLGEAHTANAVGFQIAASVLGYAALPSLVGILAERFTLEVIGPALLVTALVLLGLFEVLARLTRIRQPG
jgi:fucose permease